jgi:hypothetical protein
MGLLLHWILKVSGDGLSFRASCRALGIASNPLSKLATHTYMKKIKILSHFPLNGASLYNYLPYERYDHKEAICTLPQGLLGGEILPVAR